MTRFALPLILASPALADVTPAPRMELGPGTLECFALIWVDNRVGVYNESETLATEAGDVVVRYQTHGSHNATDHDEVTVIALPPGLEAHPTHMMLPDGDLGTICLRPVLAF